MSARLRSLLPLLAGLPFAAWSAAPNVIVVLGEGHGWSSTSVRMDDAVPESKSPVARTPNLERLAREGLRMANFYAPSPRCTPSRAALLTGKSPARLHMTFVGEGRHETGAGRIATPAALLELPAAETTVAALLQRAGYATAHFGKWHLGRADPREHGFDESDGPTGNGGPDDVENPHPKELDGMTARGMDFMARQAHAGRPFYLQLSHYASRRGGTASAEARAVVKGWGLQLGEREAAEAAADWDLDLALGRLLEKVDALGLAGTTYVIFTTDHGTPGKNPPLAGGKGTVSEGGLRVPFIVRGPGVPAGACSHVRAVGADLFPTLAELAHVPSPLPEGIEGGSLTGVWTHGGQGTVARPRAEYVVHVPHYDKDPRGPASAILLDDFKLIRCYETGARQLYNLAGDPGERNDLAAQQPEKVRALAARLSDYLAPVSAQMPPSAPSSDSGKLSGTTLDDRKGKHKR